MLFDIFLLIAGFVALTLGAEGLVRGSASLAIRIGLTPLVVGLTVVAFGTSTPELVVSLIAAFNHQPAIAVGNVVGSNIFNIGIILALTAVICPVNVQLQIVRQDGPIMIGATLLAFVLITQGLLSGWAGMGLVALLILYTAYSIWLARKEASAAVRHEFAEGVPSPSKSLYRDFFISSEAWACSSPVRAFW